MSLAPGARVGPYEVVSLLGAGGMGEVYRAHDAKLQRDVALKILPDVVAADPDRLVRFEREARTLAILNHPNIGSIYGFEGDGPQALVLELVEGETLADRIGRGPVPVDDALAIALQIAVGLEAAHDLGIIHRDLKPANIKITPQGTVKLLDFGLAKAMLPVAVGPPASLDHSPTFTSPAMTQIGVIIGTAAYMAPEQARGKSVDRRVDIWAFGCVLFEMLTGRRPFSGETVTDMLAGIVSKDPEWSALPADVPASIVRLLHRCLEKDPRLRLRDVGEARVVLEAPHAADEKPGATAPPRSQRVLVAAAALVSALVGVAAGWLLFSRPSQPTAVTLTRFDVAPPDPASTLTLVFRPAVALSANGKTLAFVATTAGVDRVYVKARGETVARAIPGSEGGSIPALSPDGEWVAFFADGKVRRARINGEATAIATARDVRGLSWTDDGMLVLSPDAVTTLVRMPAEGGQAQPLTTLAAGERTHRWADALPGGKGVLFTVGLIASPDSYEDANVEVVTAGGERRIVLRGATMARYCGDHRLLFAKGPQLFSIAFDPDRLVTSGSPVEVAAVARDPSTGAAHFACAADGTLAFVPGTRTTEQRQLVWADAAGRSDPINLPPGPYQEARVSPDGKRIALLAGNAGRGEVWIYELASGSFNRLTFNGTNAAPIWSASGDMVYYTSFDPSGAASTLMKRRWDAAGEPVNLTTIQGRSYVEWVDSQEQSAIVVVPTLDRGDILRVHFGRDTAPDKLVAGAANEYTASVSPGGEWLAYNADDTGRAEIYVRSLGTASTRRQVTTEGGLEPHWSRDGRELFYRSGNRLMAVAIDAEGTLRFGRPRPLFDGLYNSGIESGRSYDVDPTSGRFLLVRPGDGARVPQVVRVALNWTVDGK